MKIKVWYAGTRNRIKEKRRGCLWVRIESAKILIDINMFIITLENNCIMGI